MENTNTTKDFVVVNQLGRKTANYTPSRWSEFFIDYVPPLVNEYKEWYKEEADKLRETIRTMITTTTDPTGIMHLVDTIQHLGIDYHFQSEIDNKLQFLQGIKFESDDLHQVALRFRLLRQHGFAVSPDDFGKFKDEMGNFKTTLKEDTKGLLSLYNAAHLLLPDERILEEAIKFTRDILKATVKSMKSPLARQVLRALKSPLPRMMKRLEGRLYIDEYEEEVDRNDTILEFAKLDFNVVQRQHCEELKEIALWWKELNLKETLHYCRDRLAECYFWILGVYFEPCYSRARIITAKSIALMSILDDTFDVYATLEECRLLTLAIHRWDESAVDLLPEYLKGYYLTLLRTANSIESELEPCDKYRSSFYQNAFRTMAEVYLKETEWYAQDYTPEVDERKEHAILSSGYPVLSYISFIGMGEVATKEAFCWVASIPKVVRASAEICRFTDDILAYEREHEAGQVASTFDCYMKQYNASKEETTERFYSWIEDAWRTINKECLRPTEVPWTLLERIVNFAKMMQTLYTHCDDGYNKCENVEETIAILFVKPLSIRQQAYVVPH